MVSVDSLLNKCLSEFFFFAFVDRTVREIVELGGQNYFRGVFVSFGFSESAEATEGFLGQLLLWQVISTPFNMTPIEPIDFNVKNSILPRL